MTYTNQTFSHIGVLFLITIRKINLFYERYEIYTEYNYITKIQTY